MIDPKKSVRSTCPYCGVGCQIDLKIQDGKIYKVDAPFDVAPNFGRLCSKGRFGVDFVHHPSRLKTPLIRKNLGEKPRQPMGIDGFARRFLCRRGGQGVGCDRAFCTAHLPCLPKICQGCTKNKQC